MCIRDSYNPHLILASANEVRMDAFRKQYGGANPSLNRQKVRVKKQFQPVSNTHTFDDSAV